VRNHPPDDSGTQAEYVKRFARNQFGAVPGDLQNNQKLFNQPNGPNVLPSKTGLTIIHYIHGIPIAMVYL
jgi:hypothetical protein